MQGDLQIPVSLLTGFALTLTRVSSVFVFVPLPGLQAGTAVARMAVSLACTLALAPLWPRVDEPPGTSLFAAQMAGELAIGLLAGVAVAWISEIFTAGAQVISVQSGFSFASTFDPNTNADSGILIVIAQLTAGLLFFATGLDRELMRTFAWSLTVSPPGSFVLQPSMPVMLIRLGGDVFALAVRLALPVIGLLFLVDLVLGALGRINAQVQTIGIAMPVKLAASLLMLASLLGVFPLLFEKHAVHTLTAIREQLRAR